MIVDVTPYITILVLMKMPLVTIAIMGPNLSPRAVAVKNVIQLRISMWVLGGLNDENG